MGREVTRTCPHAVILLQNPVTGLLPAFLFEDGTAGWAENHAWVRDNVYSVLAVWGVAIVYRRGAESEEDREKAYNLEQVEKGEGGREVSNVI